MEYPAYSGGALERRVIKASPAKSGLLLAGSLAFVVMGLAAITADDNPPATAWLCVLFFGACSIIAALLVFRPMSLVLEPHGFTLEGGLFPNPKTTPWRDVESFSVRHLPKAGKMIAYALVPYAKKTTLLAQFNGVMGMDGTLPKGWPGSPEKLAGELSDYRQRAINAPRTAAYAPSTSASTSPGFGRRVSQIVER